MAFTPPRCPYPDCTYHLGPRPRFCSGHGCYRPQCRSAPVPRFLCKGCRRTFSEQTFRADYRDRRPECNLPLMRYLVSGVGLRQSGRNLGLDIHAVQHKFRKIARNLAHLHDNLLQQLPDGRVFLLDELETYEQKGIWPLSVAALVERDSKFVVTTGVAPIRRVARAGSRRRALLEHEERIRGRRKDRSLAMLREMFRRFDKLLRGRRATLWTDLKNAYARLCRQLLDRKVLHLRWPGKAPRTTWNPLFVINLHNAMLRDNNGRLRRRSWLVSKKGRCLSLQLTIFDVYRNYCRKRTNHDQEGKTPATELGILPRQLGMEEVLAWRQDWGLRSIHPMSRDASSTVAALAA